MKNPASFAPMLTHLSIRNLLLLKSCEIPFAAGLNVLTGETGAGKSILLDALGLVLGERSDAGLVRKGEAQASVAAEFTIEGHAEIAAQMEALGLEPASSLLIRRMVQADGKSRAFINDAPVTVTALKTLAPWLVERNGQHDQRGLLDIRTHRALLDAYAGHAPLLTQCAEAFAAWKAALSARETLAAQRAAALREEAWLRQVAEELGALEPRAGEELELVEQRKKAQLAQQSIGGWQQALNLLQGNDALSLRLREAVKILAKSGAENESLAGIFAALERAETEIEEASVALERLVDSADLDPRALEAAEDRLHALRGAARKFNTPVEGLEALCLEATSKLRSIDHSAEEERRVEIALTKARAAYLALAEQLTAGREKAGEQLGHATAKELAPLKMASTRLRVVQTPLAEAQWGEAGTQQVAFEIATNAGMPFGLLNKVASGGELSRVLLAMKLVLRGAGCLTSIFDEIDSGTGGAVAEAIGLRLKSLAGDAQVLVVTHLPQVAALASHHLFIAKSGTQEVETSVRPLNDNERGEELARMLSGATITDEARVAARKLLEHSL